MLKPNGSNPEETVRTLRLDGLPGRHVSRQYTDFAVERYMLRVLGTRDVFFVLRLRPAQQLVVLSPDALSDCGRAL